MPRGRTSPLLAVPVVSAALLAAAVLAPGGCQSGSAPPPDSWLGPPLREGTSGAGAADGLAAARPLDPSLVRLVLEPWQDEAERLLADVPWVRLTPDDAGRLAGWADAPEPDHLYLLRGIDMPALGGGHIYVTQSAAGDVSVHFGALTHRSDLGPTRRQPVVVMLDRPPRDVYVGVSVAE